MLPSGRFRWDWLCPVIPVPYVPTLGLVWPAALSATLFDAVVDNADTGRFLPYDKDRRWSSSKDERVIVKGITHEPGLTVIPTSSTRGHGAVKIYYYGAGTPTRSEMTELSRSYCATIGASVGQVIWCQRVPDGASTRVMGKTFGSGDKHDRRPVTALEGCAVADTFPAFADQLAEQGFAFLHQRMAAGISDGPILVVVDDGRIVGAVGPLTTLLDPSGARTQPPAYFAVHPGYRRRGYGRALWRAAMAWGAEHGAEYKILQAASGSPAERLYQSEGLATLGFVCRHGFARQSSTSPNAD